MFALIKDGVVAKYPYSEWEVRRQNPNTSFPTKLTDTAMAAHGAQRVYFSTRPEDLPGQVVEEGIPAFNPDAGRWEQVWVVRAKSVAELEADKQALITSVTQATQQRLDDFARTCNYDDILSACTYATSSNPKFQAEGQYCVGARDATWAALYQIMSEVEAGTRPLPSGYNDIEDELPVLQWQTT